MVIEKVASVNWKVPKVLVAQSSSLFKRMDIFDEFYVLFHLSEHVVELN